MRTSVQAPATIAEPAAGGVVVSSEIPTARVQLSGTPNPTT